MTSTLVITTYNWPEALELVLNSLMNLSAFPSEIIIADDGSGDETAEMIRAYENSFPVPLVHLWHEDDGFRRTVILNKAISMAKGDYIIQLDGDCIMHKHFVRDHLKMAEKGIYLYGSRVTIRENYLSDLFKKKTTSFSFLDKGIKKRTRNLHIPFLGRLYKSNNELSGKLRGCNLSYWKSDFMAVNGYNEDMTGWGREDSELVVRMMNNGILGKRLRYLGIIYHIFHIEKSKERLDINDAIQKRAIDNEIRRCENGVDKYLKAS
ncbi:MAG: glycosyltransferase family 2 protein [Flavobacteriaceae bacterium]|nr:glycosyltransferase family 2 protein [Flavobacteriaceae bacterium]